MKPVFAETFPPGQFLREELEERNWTQGDLAKILGKSVRLVSEVINAKRAITPETAKALGAAFETSADYWMNLEISWQLHQLNDPDDTIAKRARLYNSFPVNEILKRGWVEPSDNISELEDRFCDFYGISSIEETPNLVANFRRQADDDIEPMQIAWLYRAFNISKTLQVSSYSETKLNACFAELKELLHEPKEIRHVPRILAESGIRFLIVENLKGSKVDGVCFWLNKKSPVVAMSMRYGRIDWFWFTLLHELMHVKNRDGIESPVVDIDLIDREAETDIERTADREAAEYLIPSDAISGFIARNTPMYSTQSIVGFSRIHGIHPSLLIGQLQHRRQIPWSNFRSFLTDVRSIVLQGSVVDGWGHTVGN